MMNCPACHAGELRPADLGSGLTALACGACGGKWVGGRVYWGWLEKHGPNLPERTEPEPVAASTETTEPKKCPECGGLMFRYRVGHGLDFSLDQCAACKGVWFDGNEWESLRARNLHDDVNAVFTAPWQATVSKEERGRRMEQVYAKKFGDEDFAEIRRIRQWLDSRERKQELLAYLTDPDPSGV